MYMMCTRPSKFTVKFIKEHRAEYAQLHARYLVRLASRQQLYISALYRQERKAA